MTNITNGNNVYEGTGSLILINDILMTVISKIKSSNYSYIKLNPISSNNLPNIYQDKEKDIETEIVLECIILYNTDDELNLIKNLKDGKITQILFNEYGQYMYREINNVNYESENFNHEVSQNQLTQQYCLKSTSTFDTFKSINEEEFIKKFGTIIKKVGYCKYEKI